MQQPQQSYKIKSTAELLDCSIPTVYRMIRTGKLKTHKLGADQRVPASEIIRIQEDTNH